MHSGGTFGKAPHATRLVIRPAELALPLAMLSQGWYPLGNCNGDNIPVCLCEGLCLGLSLGQREAENGSPVGPRRLCWLGNILAS